MKSIINESKKHYVQVKVKGTYLTGFITSLYKLKIDIKSINYISDKELVIEILIEDLGKIKKEFKGLKIKKIKDVK